MKSKDAQDLLNRNLAYGRSSFARSGYRAGQFVFGAAMLKVCFGLVMPAWAAAAVVVASVTALAGCAHLNVETERNIRSLHTDDLNALYEAMSGGAALKANFFIPGSLNRIVADELVGRKRHVAAAQNALG